MNQFTNPDYLANYKSEMERQAIAQAQEFLRRYGIYPPSGNPVDQSTQPVANGNNLVTIPVASEEQVTNAPIDAFRTFIYPNLDSREIYVKKMGDNGKEEVQVFLPKGHEVEKEFQMTSNKVLEALASFDERMKKIEEKLNDQSKL